MIVYTLMLCQVPVLCMLHKHPGLLIIFPFAGVVRCLSNKEDSASMH